MTDSNCPNCAAPFKSAVCAYCGTPQQKSAPTKREVRSDMGTYAELTDAVLIGNMNTVRRAVRCVIQGHMNTVIESIDTEVRGNMNTVRVRR